MTASKVQTIPAGYYAIVWPGNGKTYFFRVTVGRSGHWKGYHFITKQSSDEFHRIPTAEGRDAAAALILADSTAALALYGQKIGRCGNCHKTLTDEDSRAFGIGPKCRKDLGLI